MHRRRIPLPRSPATCRISGAAPERFAGVGAPFGHRCTIALEQPGTARVRKARALGKRRGVAVALDDTRGKGSHQTLYFGAAFTVVRNPKDELKTGTPHGLCAQIGIKVSDL